MKRGKHMGWFIVAIAALVAYFIYKKAKPIGGVTATPAPGYGSGPGGLYSQVG